MDIDNSLEQIEASQPPVQLSDITNPGELQDKGFETDAAPILLSCT